MARRPETRSVPSAQRQNRQATLVLRQPRQERLSMLSPSLRGQGKRARSVGSAASSAPVPSRRASGQYLQPQTAHTQRHREEEPVKGTRVSHLGFTWRTPMTKYKKLASSRPTPIDIHRCISGVEPSGREPPVVSLRSTTG